MKKKFLGYHPVTGQPIHQLVNPKDKFADKEHYEISELKQMIKNHHDYLSGKGGKPLVFNNCVVSCLDAFIIPNRVLDLSGMECFNSQIKYSEIKVQNATFDTTEFVRTTITGIKSDKETIFNNCTFDFDIFGYLKVPNCFFTNCDLNNVKLNILTDKNLTVDEVKTMFKNCTGNPEINIIKDGMVFDTNNPDKEVGEEILDEDRE